MQVFDNVFSESEIQGIEKTFLTIPWFLSSAENHASVTSDVRQKYSDSNTIEGIQLTNFLFIDKPNSPFYQDGAEVLKKFCERTRTPIRNLIRIKANLQLPEHRLESQYNTPHVDNYSPHTVAIYYVNDSDGSTFFFDKNMKVVDKIESKRGRMVVFPGNTYHAGQPPTTNARIIINFNFI
jgi:hypothetical protein